MDHDGLRIAAELAAADQREMLLRDMIHEVDEARELISESTEMHHKLLVGLKIQSGLVYTLIVCLVLRIGFDLTGHDSASSVVGKAIYLFGGVTFAVIIGLHLLESRRDSKLHQAEELKDSIALRLSQDK